MISVDVSAHDEHAQVIRYDFKPGSARSLAILRHFSMRPIL
jgi:hypothetical protein